MTPVVKFKTTMAAPVYQTGGAAGFDLQSAMGDFTLAPLNRAVIPTGLFVEIPPGFEGQIRPRSGLAAKHGITVLNSPGTIDSDYRGEVGVILINLSTSDYVVTKGDHIAQMVITPAAQADLRPAHFLSQTDRGERGFGSTNWTPFDGEECPVPLDTRVQVKWRDGEISNSSIADLWDWDTDGIVAYRVVEQIGRVDLYHVAAAIMGPGCDIQDWYESDHPAIEQARRVIKLIGARA